MSDANFASLSSTLLARKGGAKPAMRPQSGIPGPVDGKEAAANLEDLGWNDMGEEELAAHSPLQEKTSQAHAALSVKTTHQTRCANPWIASRHIWKSRSEPARPSYASRPNYRASEQLSRSGSIRNAI